MRPHLEHEREAVFDVAGVMNGNELVSQYFTSNFFYVISEHLRACFTRMGVISITTLNTPKTVKRYYYMQLKLHSSHPLVICRESR